MKIGVAPLVVFLIVAAAALATKVGPTYNFDNVFYLGVAEHYRGQAIPEAHASAYSQIKAALPDADYQKILSDGTPDDLVRIPSATDADVYGQQLPFYSVKPVYPLLIAGFRAFGINGVVASFWISEVALGLLAAVCCAWLSRYYSPWAAALVSVLIAFSSGVFNIGVDPRPDCLYAAVVLLMLMLSMRARMLTSGLIALMLLSQLIRPDAVILCVMTCLAWMFMQPERYLRATIALCLTLGLYLAVTRLAGAYSWPVLMYHAYIAYLPHPRTHPSAVSVADLVRIYVKFGQPLYSQTFLTMLLVAVLALIGNLLTSPLRSAAVALSGALVVTLPLHFLVHPSDNLRVRSAYYVAALVLLLIALSNVLDKTSQVVRRWLLAAPDPALQPYVPGQPENLRG